MSDIYDEAAQKIAEIGKAEAAAAADLTITMSMPMKAAIVALLAVQVHLAMNEQFLQDRIQMKQVPEPHSRTEIEMLRLARNAMVDGINASCSAAQR